MGYYSDVVIQCNEKAYDIIKEAYEGVGVKPCKILADAYGKSRIIKFDSIEWRTYLPDIVAISQAIDSLDNDKYAGDEDYAYKFIRIGENYEDIEEKYNDIGLSMFGDLLVMMDIHIPDKHFECDGNGIPILCSEIKSVCDSYNLSILSISEQKNGYKAEIEAYSPAGKKVICDILFDGTTDGFISAFEKYAQDFDIYEHIDRWIEDGAKDSDVSDSSRILVDDAEAIRNILKNAAEDLKNLEILGV